MQTPILLRYLKKSGYLGQSTEVLKPFLFDFWAWFEYAVNELKIQPSESWSLDLVEINKLAKKVQSNQIDTSIMLNYERIKNGASKKWLQRS